VTLRDVRLPDRIGRPSIDGDRAVYHLAQRSESRIEEVDLLTRGRTTLRQGRNGAQLLNPSEQGGSLLHVESSDDRQRGAPRPARLVARRPQPADDEPDGAPGLRA